MAKKCARTFSIVVEKGKKSILEVRWLLPDALPRSVRGMGASGTTLFCEVPLPCGRRSRHRRLSLEFSEVL